MSELSTTQWCKRHESIISNAGEVCQAAINIAYRIGIDPFDSYSQRSIGKCQFIPMRIPTSPSMKLGVGDIQGRLYCEHMRLEPTHNGWHWHRGEKVQCDGGRYFKVDYEAAEAVLRADHELAPYRARLAVNAALGIGVTDDE